MKKRILLLLTLVSAIGLINSEVFLKKKGT